MKKVKTDAVYRAQHGHIYYFVSPNYPNLPDISTKHSAKLEYKLSYEFIRMDFNSKCNGGYISAYEEHYKRLDDLRNRGEKPAVINACKKAWETFVTEWAAGRYDNSIVDLIESAFSR